MSQKTPAQAREELIALLSSHDWNYGYSDDYSYWTLENAKRRQIDALVKLVPDGEALYFQYRPTPATK